jgi:uncharacterized protein (DUF2147 family)
MKKILSILTLLSWAAIVQASPLTVEGDWKTIDDETGEAKSILTLWVEDNELQGKIVELLNPSEPNPVCDECKGKLKDKPIEGMTILWGLENDDDKWSGGTILDPSNGKEYKAKVTLSDDGMSLDVRGFIGFALIGRTQVWERVE